MSSLDQVHRYFNREAERFDAIYEKDKPAHQNLRDWLFRRVILERFSLVINAIGAPGRTFIDVGCGGGRYGLELARRGAARCLGVDVAEGMIEIARREATEAGLTDRCDWTVGDWLSVDVPGDWDALAAMGYFDYLEEPAPHLRKMLSVTSGRLFASFPKRWTVRTAARIARFRLRGAFVRFYSRREVLDLFRSAGDLRYLALIDLGRDYVAIYDRGAELASRERAES
jgi:2-polyprenyl-3-methyl-5-hydroxy-6-metoxy-1,4-benzoquinol methylase